MQAAGIYMYILIKQITSIHVYDIFVPIYRMSGLEVSVEHCTVKFLMAGYRRGR